MKLSDTMVAMLDRVHRHPGSSSAPYWCGGRENTLSSLVRRGLLRFDCTDPQTGQGEWSLTPLGVGKLREHERGGDSNL